MHWGGGFRVNGTVNVSVPWGCVLFGLVDEGGLNCVYVLDSTYDCALSESVRAQPPSIAGVRIRVTPNP